ncbi:MAG TPA: host attachment protein [Chthoniobacteraceae bacterium]|nr:host attachment protein [Chthoniobacteraceae bacterium]
MKSSFFIVVDRGNLKAYRAEKVPADRPPRMQLVHALTLAEAHLKPTDIFTDEAGGFPTQTGAGGRQMVQGNSIAERHYDVENDRRLTKQLAQHIGKILRGQDVELWSFAAPADIHEAIVNQLEPSVRNRIAEHVAADLVKIPASDLLEHFTAVHAT